MGGGGEILETPMIGGSRIDHSQSPHATNLAYRADGLFYIRQGCDRCGDIYYSLAIAGIRAEDVRGWCPFCNQQCTAAEQARYTEMVESGGKPWIVP